MAEIAQRLTMGSNVSAPVVLSKIRESARSAKDFCSGEHRPPACSSRQLAANRSRCSAIVHREMHFG